LSYAQFASWSRYPIRDWGLVGVSDRHFSGAAAAYVKEGFSNIRIGMFLEIATTLGALLGATLATRVSTSAIAVVFGLVLIGSAYLSGDRVRKPNARLRLTRWPLDCS